MTIKSEVNKVMNVGTYEEKELEDGSVEIKVISTDGLGLVTVFTAAEFESLTKKEIGQRIAAHIVVDK